MGTIEQGKRIGYHVNQSKSWIIIKHEENVEEAKLLFQGKNLPDENVVKEIMAKVHNRQNTLLKQKVKEVEQSLSKNTLRAVQQAKEKGASNWLSVIPLEEHEFTLNKGEFRDAIAIRYNKALRGLLSQCPCGQKYDVTHALNCKKEVL